LSIQRIRIRSERPVGLHYAAEPNQPIDDAYEADAQASRLYRGW
jgi:hypothetical protein